MKFIHLYIVKVSKLYVYHMREGEIIMFKYISIFTCVDKYLLDFITQLFKLFKNATS